MRVGVAVVRRAVGRPARVAHAGRPGDRARRELLVEVLDAAGLLLDLQRVVVADDRDAGRVVAAVFEATQALDDDVEGCPRTDVADDAAHVREFTGWCCRSMPNRTATATA